VPTPGANPSQDSAAKSPSLRSIAKRLLDHAGSALVGGLVALGIAWGVGVVGKGPGPIPRQLDAVLRDAAQQRLTVAYNRELDLRGTGEMARLLILRPTIAGGYTKRSDELRIYETDRDGTRLQLALRLQPLTKGKEVPFRINFVDFGRFGDGDRQQAIVRLDPSYADGRLPRPIAVEWDARYGRYRARGLLKRRVSLPPTHSVWALEARRLYRPTDIPLVDGSVLRQVGGANDVAVRRHRLVAAYVVRQDCNACTGTWEFKSWRLDFDEPQLSGYECRFYSQASGRPERFFAKVRQLGDIARGLRVALQRPCA
jgi:hypothetical protein